MTAPLTSRDGWSVREARIPEDSEAVCAVSNLYDSDPLSVAEFERLHATWPEEDPRLRLVAVDGDGTVMAASHCRRRASMVPGLFSLSVNVLPTWCRKGIGSELLRRSEAFALSNGATKVTAFVPDEYPSGRPFTESHGYRETRRLFESVLSVASVDDSETERTVARAIADGLTFQTLADLGDTEAERRRLHAVTVECDLDEPATAEYGGLEWGDYCRSVFEAEWYRPEGVFVAKRGDEWAGVHVIGPMTGSPVADMTTDFTGVRRPFRGKGLATVLKRLGVRYALHTGGTRILTHNDSTNVPMLAVNQKLGFVARSGLLFMTKEFEV